jgi:hypothetical protein
MNHALLLALVVGCAEAHAGSSDDVRVYDAVERAWYESPHNLHAVHEEWDDCENLSLFYSRVADDDTEVLMLCRQPANACLLWSLLPGVGGHYQPYALISPTTVPAARRVAVAEHELVHAFSGCAGYSARSHEDQRIFRPNHDSVEAVALRALYPTNRE